MFDEGIFDAIDLVNCTEGRISEGGPCAASVHRQVEQAAAQLAQWKEKHHG